jgi:hypothetical protein
MSAFGGKADMAGFGLRPKNLALTQRRVRILKAQLLAAKVSNPRFRAKVRKFPRHFKGHFSIGNMQVRILRGQPGIPRFREFPSLDEEGPAKRGLFSLPLVSGDRCSNFFGQEFLKVSSRIQENSCFLETLLGDRRINPLRARRASALRLMETGRDQHCVVWDTVSIKFF